MSRSRLRGVAATTAKALVSIALIAFALRGFDSGQVLGQLAGVELGALAAAAVLATAISLLHARRWEVVLARMEHALPYREALRLVLIGYFFNQTLPSTIGGDAYRAWGAYQRGIHAGNAITSVVVDRTLALASLVAMIALGAGRLIEIAPVRAMQWFVVLLVAGGCGGFAALLALGRFAPTLRRWRPTRMLLQVSEGARAVVKSAPAALEVLLLTVAGYVAISYVVYILAHGIGVELALEHALLFVPLVTLVSVVPVSIGGWGVRENAMVAALGLVSVPSVQAFALSVLYGLVVMASGAPGGVLWLATRRQPTARPPSDFDAGTR